MRGARVGSTGLFLVLADVSVQLVSLLEASQRQPEVGHSSLEGYIQSSGVRLSTIELICERELLGTVHVRTG